MPPASPVYDDPALMPLKTLLLAVLALAIGYIVGLPLGAVTSLGRNARAAGGASDPAPGGSTTLPSTKPASSGHAPSSADASNPLGAKLLEIYDLYAEPGFLAFFGEFDEKAAALLGSQSTDALRALALEWSHRGDDAVPKEALCAAFMHWALRDPGAAWQAAMAAPEKSKADALTGCLRALSASDHLAALAKAESIADKKLRGQLRQEIAGSESSRFWKPEPLARRLLAIPERERPKGLLKEVMESWAQRHLAAALEFAKAMPQEEREETLAELCQGVAFFDRDEAIRIAGTIRDPRRSAETWRGILSSLGEAHPGEAASLLESLPLEQMDPEVFKCVRHLHLPPEAMGRIAARLTGENRDEFLSNVFDKSFQFSSQQLQARLDAIELQPEDGPWVERVVQRMTDLSPDATLAWAGGLPESRMRDFAFAGAKEDLIEHKPAEAMRLAAGIQDENKRLREMRSGLDQWLRHDRVAAIGWLRGAGAQILPAAERERWLGLSGAKP